jgi:hypothetical protein
MSSNAIHVGMRLSIKKQIAEKIYPEKKSP